MTHRILLTGSSGLVGRALRPMLEAQGFGVQCFDLQAKGDGHGDIRFADCVQAALQSCDGVVHLAAISRVVQGERDLDLCWSTNVDGTWNVLETALRSKRRPWVLFTSSREVYGHLEALPAIEDARLFPVNVYGRSKLAGERLLADARGQGLRTAILRLSNVYGNTRDHADRVVPAFTRAAVQGLPLRVYGADHTFDFTHIDDVIRGILALVYHLNAGGKPLPPIHLVTGKPTTLRQLAELAIEIADSTSSVRYESPRDFDVTTFYGSPARASTLLGWSPNIPLRQGISSLIQSFRNELGTPFRLEAAS